MLAVALQGAGEDVSYLIGATVPALDGAAAHRSGRYLVLEADESDGSFLAGPRAAALVTNIEPDHLEFWGGFDALLEAFGRFLDETDGPRLVCADDAGSAALGERVGARSYGRSARGRPPHDRHRARPPRIDVHDARARRRGAGATRRPRPPQRHQRRRCPGPRGRARARRRPGGRRAGRVHGGGETFRTTGRGRRRHRRGRLRPPPDRGPGGARRRHGAADGDGSWSCSSRIGTHGPRSCGTRSAMRSATPTCWFSPSSIPPARLRGRGSRESCSSNAVLDRHPWRRLAWMPTLDDVVSYLRGELRAGDLCMTVGAGDVTTVGDRILGELSTRSDAVTPATRGRRSDEALGFLGPRLADSAPIGPSTTYRVGGPARFRVEIQDADDLRQVAASLVRAVVAGRAGADPRDREGIEPPRRPTPGSTGSWWSSARRSPTVAVDGTTVRAGAAASLPVVARRTVAAGLTGFEWAVGVPGSIGGAVRMNAGGHGVGHGRDRFAASASSTSAPGKMARWRHRRLDLGYRSSAVRDAMVVTEATLALAVGDRRRGTGDAVRDRRMATGEPTGWAERRVGVHEPPGRLGRSSHRGVGMQGPAHRDRRDVDEARELHPGGRRAGRPTTCSRSWWTWPDGCSIASGSSCSPRPG